MFTRNCHSCSAVLSLVPLLAACQGTPRDPADFTGHRQDAVTVCASGSTVSGVDVSSWQGSINWGAVAGAGKSFAIARISDGTYKDTDFAANWAGMKAQGLVRGSYQFYEASEDPTTQANIAVAAVGRLGPGDLPVTADLESGGGKASVAQLQTWVSVVTNGTGKAPMIYASEGYWNGTYNGDFSTYPLWVANWGVSCPDTPSGWSHWDFWQSSDDGSVAGISGRVDTDLFNGSLAQLQAFAGGSSDKAPIGYLDEVDCGAVAGWSQDPDVPTQSINVDVYFSGPAGSGATGIRLMASASRPDLCSALGSCDHAFQVNSPRSMMDGAAHAVHAYGIDAEGGNNPELSNSPRTLTCAPAETGVLRHVINPTSYSAWAFSGFQDVRPVPDATLASWGRGDDWPAAPQLIQGTGDPAVYLVDGPYRRHVISPDSATAWHFDLATDIHQLPLAQVQALPQGPDLGARPTLVKGSGAEIDELDVALPPLPAADAGPAPEADAGADPAFDAGEAPPEDAGAAEVPDAGRAPDADAGAPDASPDAGSPEIPDAGWLVTVDAGSPSHSPTNAADAGAGGSPAAPLSPSGTRSPGPKAAAGGCQQAAGIEGWALVLVLGALRRRFDSPPSALTVSG